MAKLENNPFQPTFRRIVTEFGGTLMEPGDPKLLSKFALHCPEDPYSGPLHLRIFSFSQESQARAAYAIAPQTELDRALLWNPNESMKLRDIWNIWATDAVVDQSRQYDAEFFGAQRDNLLRLNWLDVGCIPTGPDAQRLYVARFEDPKEEPLAKAALCLLGIRAQTKLADCSIGELIRREQSGEDLSKEPRHLMITETHLRALRTF